jgi:hypothetical protein
MRTRLRFAAALASALLIAALHRVIEWPSVPSSGSAGLVIAVPLALAGASLRP